MRFNPPDTWKVQKWSVILIGNKDGDTELELLAEQLNKGGFDVRIVSAPEYALLVVPSIMLHDVLVYLNTGGRKFNYGTGTFVHYPYTLKELEEEHIKEYMKHR